MPMKEFLEQFVPDAPAPCPQGEFPFLEPRVSQNENKFVSTHPSVHAHSLRTTPDYSHSGFQIAPQFRIQEHYLQPEPVFFRNKSDIAVYAPLKGTPRHGISTGELLNCGSKTNGKWTTPSYESKSYQETRRPLVTSGGQTLLTRLVGNSSLMQRPIIALSFGSFHFPLL